MLYRFARFIFLVYLKLFYRLRVTGRENVPQRGPFIICANHINWIDAVVIGCSIPSRLKVHFMAKRELFRNSFFGYLLKKVGAFPVDRDAADYNAIRRSYQVINENNILGLFPEGSRSKLGKLQKAQPGSALIAGRTGAPILPVAVLGPYRIGRPLHIRIGPLFELPRFEYEHRQDKKDLLEEMSCLIMENIKKLFL